MQQPYPYTVQRQLAKNAHYTGYAANWLEAAAGKIINRSLEHLAIPLMDNELMERSCVMADQQDIPYESLEDLQKVLEDSEEDE